MSTAQLYHVEIRPTSAADDTAWTPTSNSTANLTTAYGWLRDTAQQLTVDITIRVAGSIDYLGTTTLGLRPGCPEPTPEVAEAIARLTGLIEQVPPNNHATGGATLLSTDLTIVLAEMDRLREELAAR